MGPIQRPRRTISLSLCVLIFCLGLQKAPILLRAFAIDLHAVHHARSQPSLTQQNALSSAQQLVRNVLQSIIEPMLASFDLSSDSSEKSNWHPTPHLKNSNCAAYPYVIRADPTRFGSHVHRRREIGSISQRPTFCYRQSRDPSQCIPHIPPHDPRRPPPTRPPALTAKTDKCAPMLPHPAKKEKPRPETCNQAWSVSEQHLLDRLLSQIPDGEKNRYERLFLSLTHA